MGDVQKEISEQAYNALSELGNIGAGNAATSLSVLLSSKLIMTPPTVAIYDFDSLGNILGGADANVVGVMSSIVGDIQAMILFVVGVDDARHLVKSLIGSEIQWHSEMGMSAISEIANIIIGSYVGSLENLSGMKMRYSQPSICIDMAGAIISVPCIEFGKVSDKALLIDSQFRAGEQKINGYIMVVSEIHSFNVLLHKLGIGGIDE